MRYATVRDLSRNPAKTIAGNEPVVITRNGKPSKIIIPFEEDMLLLNEPKVKSSINKSRKAKAAGDKGKIAKMIIGNKRERKNY